MLPEEVENERKRSNGVELLTENTYQKWNNEITTTHTKHKTGIKHFQLEDNDVT